MEECQRVTVEMSTHRRKAQRDATLLVLKMVEVGHERRHVDRF